MPRRSTGAKLQWREDRGLYYIVWTERGRSRKCSTGTADIEAAQVVFAEWLQSRERRDGPSDTSKVLVTDLLATYAKARTPKVTAPEVMLNAIERLIPFWTGKVVTDATPETCSKYGESRQRSDGTVRRELGVLQAAINWGHKNGKLTRSVAVELPASPPPRERWLTRHEAARLLRASCTKKARLYMPLFILMGLYTGRRKEAILALRWPQVDLDRGVIDFRKPGAAETNKKRGFVRIPDRLLPHLRRARKRGMDLGYVLHVERERIVDGKRVVRQERIKNIKKGFEASCIRAGLVTGWLNKGEATIKGAPCTLIYPDTDVTPHILRHTAATWVMQAGVSIEDASRFLSMSEQTLRRVYWHYHPDFTKGAADAIGRRPGWRMGA